MKVVSKEGQDIREKVIDKDVGDFIQRLRLSERVWLLFFKLICEVIDE